MNEESFICPVCDFINIYDDRCDHVYLETQPTLQLKREFRNCLFAEDLWDSLETEQ